MRRGRRQTVQSAGMGAILAALVIFLVLKCLPAVQTIGISFQNYNPMMGTKGSAFVGLQNYSRLFSSPYFASLRANSLILGVLGIAVPCGLAFLLAVPVSGAVSGKNAGYILAALLFPAFIPELTILRAIPTESFYWKYLLAAGIKTMFFALFLASLLGWLAEGREKKSMSGMVCGILLTAGCKMICIFSPNENLVLMLQNPQIYHKADIFDTYTYRTGLMQMDFSAASAAWSAKLLFQLPFLLAAVVLGSIFIKNYLIPDEDDFGLGSMGRVVPKSGLAAVIVAGTAAITALVLVAAAGTAGGNPGGTAMGLSKAVFVTAGNTGLAVLAFSVFTILASYGVYSLFGPVGLLFCGILIFISGNSIGEHLFWRGAGMMNTQIPVVFSHFINGTLVLSLAVIGLVIHGGRGAGFSEYLKKMLPYFVLFTGLFAAQMWGEWSSYMLYTMDSSKWGLGMLARQYEMADTGSAAAYWLLGGAPFIMGLLSVIFFGWYTKKENYDYI